jgi:phospholipid-transporting ATPase
LAFSAAKEALEDFNRYRADQAANTTPAVVGTCFLILIVRNGVKGTVNSLDIVPGDILYIQKGSKFPVDGVLSKFKH